MNSELLLDNDWIDEFEKIDKSYDKFYLKEVISIKLHFTYIDKDYNIIKIKHDNIKLETPNKVSREEILGIIKRNTWSNYKLMSVLKYNIDLDVADVKLYQKNSNSNSDSFLHPIKNIDTIPLRPTIGMFQNMNTLFFVFHEKDMKIIKNKTRRLINRMNKTARFSLVGNIR